MRARELHRRAIVIDGSQWPTFDRQYFDDLSAGGLTAVCALTQLGLEDRGAREGMLALQRTRDWVAANADRALLAAAATDIERAKAKGMVAVVPATQLDTYLEGDVTLLRVYCALGLRIFQLTYNRRGPLGDGCLEPANAGLSLLGRAAVQECNRLGLVIDLSHCGDRTVWEALELSEDPVCFTHANPRARANSPRNKTDEQIKAVAARGGVIGVTFYSPIAAVRPGVPPTLEDVLDHLDHVCRLVGTDHVAFGSDWNLWNTRDPTQQDWQRRAFLDKYPEMLSGGDVGAKALGLEHCTDAPALTGGLVARGYSDPDVLKILGGNWLRLFRRVWGA